MRIEALSFSEAADKLAGEAGLEVPQTSPAERAAQRRRADLHGVLEACCQFFESALAGPGGAEARTYLERRGIDPETRARFRLGYAPDSRAALRTAVMDAAVPEAMLVDAGMLVRPESGTPYDRFRRRLMFPITDRSGRVIAFGGRVLGDGVPKYLNSPDTPLFRKGAVLYGMATARRAARDKATVVVVEGYTDVIALARAGIAEAVAPLGTALTESHLAALWRLADEPILCFDGDAAGARAAGRAAERALPILRPGKSLQFVSLPAGEDPDSLLAHGGPAAVAACLTRARGLDEVIWETARRRPAPGHARARRGPRTGARPAGRWHRRPQGPFSVSRPHAPTPGGASRLSPHGPGRSARRRGADPAALVRQSRRFVLATVLRHPGLAEEFCERLSDLDMAEERLDKLLREILMLIKEAPGLDASALRLQLTGADAEAADALLCVDTFAQWPIARPESSIESARPGLAHLLDRLMKPALDAEVGGGGKAPSRTIRATRTSDGSDSSRHPRTPRPVSRSLPIWARRGGAFDRGWLREA